MLSTSDKELEVKKTGRMGKALKRSQESLIDRLEAEHDKLQGDIEELESVTTKTVDTGSWCEEYQKAKIALGVISHKIKIANATLAEFFTDSPQEIQAK